MKKEGHLGNRFGTCGAANNMYILKTCSFMLEERRVPLSRKAMRSHINM